MPRLILLNKPYDVLCQFTDEGGRATLKNYVPVPDVYPAGRLDRDSEGLVLLTDDGSLQHRISAPRFKMSKTYLVQVEGIPDQAALEALQNGLDLGGELTLPCQARPIEAPAWLWSRTPPVRFRQHIPTAWLEIELNEGKNRQVRRMTAKVGLPTLRLIRIAIGPWRLGELAPGAWREAEVPASIKAGLRPDGPEKGRRQIRSQRHRGAAAPQTSARTAANPRQARHRKTERAE